MGPTPGARARASRKHPVDEIADAGTPGPRGKPGKPPEPETRQTGDGEEVRRATWWVTPSDIKTLEEIRITIMRVEDRDALPDKSEALRYCIRHTAQTLQQ